PRHRVLDDDQRARFASTALPLRSARLKLTAEDAHFALIESVLAEEGLHLNELKLKGLREMFFSKGQRSVLCQPTDVQYALGDDELNAGKQSLALSFELPRGSYATMVI